MIKGRPLGQNKKQDIVNCDEVKIELEERCTQWRNFTWSGAQVQSIGEHQMNFLTKKMVNEPFYGLSSFSG